MTTDLSRIGPKSRKEPNLIFTSLYHHITDVDNLRSCYMALYFKWIIRCRFIVNLNLSIPMLQKANAYQCILFKENADKILEIVA